MCSFYEPSLQNFSKLQNIRYFFFPFPTFLKVVASVLYSGNPNDKKTKILIRNSLGRLGYQISTKITGNSNQQEP